MDPLERQLKRALEPQEPPAGFAERVLARAPARTRATDAAPRAARQWWRLAWNFRSIWRPSRRMALAGGLAGLMLLAGGLAYHQRQERVRGEAARAELMTALQIASFQLNRVRQVVVQEARRPQEVRQ